MAYQDTSLMAYETLYCAGRGQTTALKILQAMRPGRSYSLAQLEKITGMRANSVSGRVHDLKGRGFIQQMKETSRCPITKETVRKVYRPKPMKPVAKEAA